MAGIPTVSARVGRNSPGMTESEIAAVVSPPLAQRNRSVTNPRMPTQEAWRFEAPIGSMLDPAVDKIRSNHFLVNISRLPSKMFQYHLHLRKYVRGVLEDADIAHVEDTCNTIALVNLLRSRHSDWIQSSSNPGRSIGFAYDGRSTIFTTEVLPLGDAGTLEEDLRLLNPEGVETGKKYRLTITLATEVLMPFDQETWVNCTSAEVMRALDTGLLEYARRQMFANDPVWFLAGNKSRQSKVFNSRSNADCLEVAPAMYARRGYSVSLKNCLAGVCLVMDMSVCVFLSGGPIINVVFELLGYASYDALVNDLQRRRLTPQETQRINDVLKNTKVRLTHLGHTKKFKELGPPANSNDSQFLFEEVGRNVTVAEYYSRMAVKPSYRNAMGGRESLKYPFLPTVNVGSLTHPVLIPMELVVVLKGQNFSHKCTPDMTSKVVRYAAVVPEERFRNLDGAMTGQDPLRSAICAINQDETATAFGVNEFNTTPMLVASKLLPQPKLT